MNRREPGREDRRELSAVLQAVWLPLVHSLRLELRHLAEERSQHARSRRSFQWPLPQTLQAQGSPNLPTLRDVENLGTIVGHS